MTQLETPMDTVLELARMAKEAGKCMILDPSPARADLPEEIFPLIDIIKPNKKELSRPEQMKKLKRLRMLCLPKGFQR